MAEQPTLFDWVQRAAEATSQSGVKSPGSLDIDAEFRAAISGDLKACPLSRYQVAAHMSELVGWEITESMLYSWTAESKERHRFPVVALPAFVIATGRRTAFETLSRAAGLFALPGPEALRAEIQRIDEAISRQKQEKHKRLLYLKEIDGGGSQ